MVTKTKYPGICNNCGKRSEFYIRCGAHTLQLCGTCAFNLGCELKIAVQTKERDKIEEEYNNSVETGSLPPIDPSKYKVTKNGNVIKDTGRVPKTGGVV